MPYTYPTTAPSRKHTATIASGASLSDAVAIQPTHTLAGILMPAAWDAAGGVPTPLTFQGSFDGTNYGDLYDDTGIELTIPAAAGRIIPIADSTLRTMPYLKIRSGTSATPVAQTAERTITLFSHP